MDFDALAHSLQPHYSRFDVANRLLFTGHSHQAWPDVAREGLEESFDVAARDVDTKWSTAFERIATLRHYLQTFYDDPNGNYTLAWNTHHLLVAWLSALDLKNKPTIVTTDNEFHSMYRQLHRLREEGITVNELPGEPLDDLPGRIEEALSDDVAAVMISRVYFMSGLVNPHLEEIGKIARNHGVPLLIDDYHGTNVTPISLREANLEDVYVMIGGYKYLQWGEGNCFMRYPKDCSLRPAITGWFSSFSTLDEPRDDAPTQYADEHMLFASGTFDPASPFRAAHVTQFFQEQSLTPQLLEALYRQRVSRMRTAFEDLNLDPELITPYHQQPPEANGGFLALTSPKARDIRAELLKHGVYTDARGEILRLGPAPYTTDAQIDEAMRLLGTVARKFK